MPRLSIWNSGRKGQDFQFFDRTISEFFGVGGTAAYVHLYIGPHDQGDGSAYTPPLPGSNAPQALSERSIQDVLFLENRDRKYSDVVYELRGIYNVSDADFDLRQFGLFLANDTLFIEFHLNDMIALCGRRLIPGDVIELPHQRDDTIPGGVPASNKFYVVEDANRASDGYSATWFPHIWRVKVSPMPASQEFEDILDQNTTDPLGFSKGKLGDLFTTIGTELGLNDAVVEEAVANVPKRFFETQQFWFVPGNSPCGGENPWVFAGGGDAIPPNGATPVGSGNRFPSSATIGDYYLRTDYQPAALFRYDSNRWVMQEVNWRGSNWSVAHRLLLTFLNQGVEGPNNTIIDPVMVRTDGSTTPQKQNLSQALKPRADF